MLYKLSVCDKQTCNQQEKASEETKAMRRKWRRICKGLADKQKEKEGVLCEAGAFGDDPGPSKRAKNMRMFYRFLHIGNCKFHRVMY